MQGGQLDVLLHVPVEGAQALLTDPALKIVTLKSSAHEELHMRTDAGPFVDKRVRRAVALCLNRENLVKGLFRGLAVRGNDSPFAPIFPATDPTVPQRDEDLRAAKALLEAAGVPNGFKATLTTERFQEMPDYAVVIQNAVRKIGIELTLNVEDQSTYYGRATYGQSDWLDSVMGIEDYAHRGVPNTLLDRHAREQGHLQRRPLPECGVRQAGRNLHCRPRSRRPARRRRADPAPAARRDAGGHRLFLRLAVGDREGRHRHPPDRDGASVPERGAGRVREESASLDEEGGEKGPKAGS